MENRARLLKIGVLLALALGLFPSSAEAKKKQELTGVIGGTVFQRTGFALPNASVTVTPVPADGSKIKKKEIKSLVTDSRGEYAVRVPGGGMRYTVKVEAEGWQSQEKEAEIPWDQRVDVNFRLKPASEGETSQ